jgi:hypothetical protein
MTNLLTHVAVISESQRIGLDALSIVAAALQKQVSRDFGPIWGVNATVDAFPRLEDVPIDYWKILLMDDIQQDGAAGVHLDDQGQPFALVTSDNDRDVWSLTASHECLEMLADPFGNRLIAGDSPMEGQGRVQILVEVADPSEDSLFAYRVNGVLVSDFYTPHFFDPIAADNVRYSFTGAITEPRQVLSGGYLSWVEPETNEWFQEVFFGGNEPTFRSLGQLSARSGSFRSQIDALTVVSSLKSKALGRRTAAMNVKPAPPASSIASAARADALRRCVQELTPKRGQGGLGSEKQKRRRPPRANTRDS